MAYEGITEYRVLIGDVMYEMDEILSVKLHHPLFDKLSVGNCTAAELNIDFWPKAEIPTMAKIIPYARKNSLDQWTQLGVFYIYTRDLNDGLMSIVAYDAMLKAEIIWEPDQSLEFNPMTMRQAVEEIAGLMGVSIDSRTVVDNVQKIVDYPANDYTLRDVLGFIGGAHAGNWIITAKGELLLIPLFSTLPPETHYLVTEYGSPITFGGVKILV